MQIDIQSVFGSCPSLEVERPHEQQQSSAGREAKIRQWLLCSGLVAKHPPNSLRVGSSCCSTRIGATWLRRLTDHERSRYGFVSKFGVLRKGPFIREHDDSWGHTCHLQLRKIVTCISASPIWLIHVTCDSKKIYHLRLAVAYTSKFLSLSTPKFCPL